MAPVRPSLRSEKQLMRAGRSLVAGVDEVGRGALCGPVSVGVVVVDASVGRVPAGLADSKLLAPEQRVRLAPRVRRWARASAVGHAGADEIDAVGIIAALRLAGCRALARLPEQPDVVLLDGSHDWLTPPDEQGDLFAQPLDLAVAPPPVVTQVKADLRCAAVAAASVLAKTERDALMVELSGRYPKAYGWAENKGYAAPAHVDALRLLGATDLHRRSWRLPLDDAGAFAGELAGPSR